MAVTSVTELFDERSGFQDHDVTRYVRVFRVTTGVNTNGPSTVLAASYGGTSIPAIGAAYPADANALLKNKEARPLQSGEPRVWNVICNYDTDAMPSSPLDEDPDISWGFTQYTTVVEYDKNGDRVCNSAWDPFDPPIEREISRMVCVITRNQATFDPDTYGPYVESTNSGALTIADLNIPARCGRMRNITSQTVRTPTLDYFRVTFEIEVNFDNFDVKALDIGYYYLQPAPGGTTSKVRFEDKKGNPMTEPQPLNGSGGKQNTSAATFLSFRVLEEKAWGNLSLPATQL